jgi:GTP-binding protein
LANPYAVKLKYMTQVSNKPPTFAVFVNRHQPESALDEAYKRFLINRLKESFDLHGVPVRIIVRSSGNPFLDRSRPRKPKAQPESSATQEDQEEAV